MTHQNLQQVRKTASSRTLAIVVTITLCYAVHCTHESVDGRMCGPCYPLVELDVVQNLWDL